MNPNSGSVDWNIKIWFQFKKSMLISSQPEYLLINNSYALIE
jgi:hypothetical protein